MTDNYQGVTSTSNKLFFPKIPFSFATNPKDGAEAAVPIGKAVAACEAVPRRKGAEKKP